MKICIPVSYGGHFTQILTLLPKLRNHDVFFVTFYHERLRNYKYQFYFVEDPVRNFFKLFKIFLWAVFIFIKERPDVILSTGANVAVPFFLIGKLTGKRLIFIESVSRVTKPSLSGKIIYKLANLFFIQWKSLKHHYPRAVYAGRLL